MTSPTTPNDSPCPYDLSNAKPLPKKKCDMDGCDMMVPNGEPWCSGCRFDLMEGAQGE